VHDRKVHRFTISDATRILDKLVPPEDALPRSWAQQIIEALKQATLSMLSRILWFLDESHVETLYDFGIRMLDHMFNIPKSDPVKDQWQARRIIQYVAGRAGLVVTIE